jgi:hypothetical protein
LICRSQRRKAGVQREHYELFSLKRKSQQMGSEEPGEIGSDFSSPRCSTIENGLP